MPKTLGLLVSKVTSGSGGMRFPYWSYAFTCTWGWPASVVVTDACWNCSDPTGPGAPVTRKARDVARPGGTALKFCCPATVLNCHCVLAIPFASVTLVVGDTVPPPVRTTQFTVTPGTGLL